MYLARRKEYIGWVVMINVEIMFNREPLSYLVHLTHGDGGLRAAEAVPACLRPQPLCPCAHVPMCPCEDRRFNLQVRSAEGGPKGSGSRQRRL